MKILVIFTGGTIGTSEKDGYLTSDESRKYMLLEHYKSSHPQAELEFDTLSPYTILSENLEAEYINALLSCVCRNADKGYDGIIVTHGTDTLQYSAAALSYALGDRLPVLLVSSNYPLHEKRANGFANLEAAVRQIAEKKRGVFVAYRNEGEETGVFHPLRLSRHGEMDDRLVEAFRFGEEKALKPLGEYKLSDSSGVLNILCHPGDVFDYSLDNVKAILIQPYHSGTLPTSCVRFRAFCKRAEKENIPIFAVNAPKGITYESMKGADELNITVLPTCAAIPIYIKLWIAASRDEDIAEFMKTDLCGEYGG